MAVSAPSSSKFNKDQLSYVEAECNAVLVHVHDVVERVWTTKANGFCRGMWDGLACWPPTLPGHLASQPCQRYLEGHHNLMGCQGMATRLCTQTGEWFINPQTNAAWTNYSDCWPTQSATTTTQSSFLLNDDSDSVAGKVLEMVAPDELTAYAVSAAAAGKTPSDALWHEMRTNYMSHIQAISIMSSIGYLTSLVLLCIALGILIAVRRLKSPRNKLLINLSASFMLRATVIIMIRYLPLEEWATDVDLSNMFHIRASYFQGQQDSSAANSTTLNDVALNVMYPHACIESDRTVPFVSPLWSLCRIGELVKHYSLLANYFWILMEGFYLNNILTFALFSEHSWLYAYICGGWLPPAIFVGIWATFKLIYANDQCWHTEVYNDPHFWIIRGPITAAIFLSFVVFVNILRIVCTKLAGTREIDQSLQTPIKRRYAKLAKSFLCLIPLCGTHYVLTLTLADIKNPRTQVAWLFIEQLFTSFQGAVVALIYIFFSGDVRREIQRALTRRRSSKFKTPRSANGAAGGNGSRKRSATARKNSNNNNNRCPVHHHRSSNANKQQHQQLRNINSSPASNNNNNGYAMMANGAAPHPQAAGGQQQSVCTKCCRGGKVQTFRLKQLNINRGGRFHCFHPLLNKSLTLTSLLHTNSGGQGTTATVVANGVNNNNIANGHVSAENFTAQNGKDLVTQSPLENEHLLTAVAAAVTAGEAVVKSSHFTDNAENARIFQNGWEAQAAAAAGQHGAATTKTRHISERSSGGGGGGGGNGGTLLINIEDVGMDDKEVCSIRIHSSSGGGGGNQSDSSFTTAFNENNKNSSGILELQQCASENLLLLKPPVDTDDGATDNTDDEEGEEEDKIGERLMQNRHLYD